MDAAGTAAILATVIGIPVISLLKNPAWRAEVNYLIGLTITALLAVTGTWVDGGFDDANVAANIGIAIAVSQTVYNTVVVGGLSKWNNKLTAVGTGFTPEELE